MTSIIAPAARRTVRPRPHPTHASQALFEAKAMLLRVGRALAELGRAPPKLKRAPAPAAFRHEIARSETPLWADPNLSEQTLQLGKVQNLRRAAARLDGLLVPAGQVFSFWRHVGRATRARGFATGRMLRGGCLMPAVGGGLCQLSNALYDVALQGGCRILERHAHSFRPPGAAGAEGRDATVAWNYVDLRFAGETDLMVGIRLTQQALIVSLWTRGIDDGAAQRASTSYAEEPEVGSCDACDETDCAFQAPGVRSPGGRSAYVVDEWWPEFAQHVAAQRGARDLLLAPTLRRWPAAGFGETRQARVPAALRSLGWRVTPPQGAARRAADAAATALIAKALARRLPIDAIDVTVAQSLLPHLWREGALGGRSVRVLMTRLPIGVLQARLDALAAAHPERRTLADYRAEPWLDEAESEALAAADEIITPHAEIAALFGERARLIKWRRPDRAPRARPGGDVFVFPGPALARKGAYEMREAARRLGARLRPLGPALEGPGFWSGVILDRPLPDAGWLDGARAVVLPAATEAAPRKLLEALAAGVPVIATAACGLAPQPGLTLVPIDDVDALAAAMAGAQR